MKMLSQPTLDTEADRFILTNKEAENGRQTNVTFAMESSDNEDSATQMVPSLSDDDTATDTEIGDSGVQSISDAGTDSAQGAPSLPAAYRESAEVFHNKYERREPYQKLQRRVQQLRRQMSAMHSRPLQGDRPEMSLSSSTMRDSGLQRVPSLTDADDDLPEVTLYLETDGKREEGSCLIDPGSEQTAEILVEETQPPECQHVSHVFVCSSEAVENAKEFQNDLVDKSQIGDTHMVICNDKDDFESQLTAYTSMDTVYILADSTICNAMLRKKSLHASISDLFEKLVETSKVYFVRRDDTRYDLVKGQLPDDVLEHKEIVISTENRAFLEEMQAQNESGVLQKKLQDTKNNTEQGVIAQQNNVMVGSHCKLTLGKGNHQMVAIRQDGSHNIVNVQIVPATTASKVLVVITTDPTNRELEKSIVQEVRADMEVVNICLSHYDGKLILIEEGSIVIELDVAQGKTIGFDYLQNVIGAIFQGNIKELVPEGTKFTVDAEVKNVIPLSKLQEYYSGYAVRDEDLHINCVNKDRYEDVLKQLENVTRELEDLKRKAKHDRTSFTEHGGLKVTIVSGDITDEQTDVVVNSTNSQLLLSDGDLSGDILKAAGSSIQKECRKQNPSPLKVGDLAVTGGGKLSCKEIYHVVLSDKWLSQQKQTELSLRDVLKKCLHQADKSRHSSISFPALGMGKLQYDPEAVVPVMYDVILNFKPTALEEVRFVILPKCPEIRQIFSEKDKFKHLVRSQSEPADLEFGKHRTIQKMEIEDQPIVKWKIGDISHMKVDVVVNTTDKSLNLASGPISQAVLKAAGKGVQEECRKEYPKGIVDGEFAITSGGNLCKHIFHISLWPWTGQGAMKEDFLDLIDLLLEKARERDHRSIAFPMLGTGTLKYPPETVATWLSDAFDKETNNTTSLKTIYVVVHPNDLKNIEALEHIGKL